MKFYKSISLVTFSTLLLLSCTINQTVNKVKQGRWVYTDTTNNVIYRNTGIYKNGLEKNTWKYYMGEKLVKKEKYRKGICKVTNYYENGKISSQGNTKLVVTDSLTHWHYSGKWIFFNNNQQINRIKTYEDGELKQDSIIEN